MPIPDDARPLPFHDTTFITADGRFFTTHGKRERPLQKPGRSTAPNLNLWRHDSYTACPAALAYRVCWPPSVVPSIPKRLGKWLPNSLLGSRGHAGSAFRTHEQVGDAIKAIPHLLAYTHEELDKALGLPSNLFWRATQGRIDSAQRVIDRVGIPVTLRPAVEVVRQDADEMGRS